MDNTKAPKGSFSFADVYCSLAPGLRSDYCVKVVAVWLRSKGSASEMPGYALYTKDKITVRRMMSNLWDKSAPMDRVRLANLLSVHPFVPNN